jgi:uncharacterized protein (TIGR03067 family)
MLRSRLTVAVFALGLAIGLDSICRAAEEEKDPLLGVWNAKSLETEGAAAPDDAFRLMRFTFKEKTVLIRGNFGDDREEECEYKSDPKKKPKQLDISPPKQKHPVVAIYEVKGDELKICLRHGPDTDGRPTEFATTPGSRLVLMVLKRQK